MATTARRRSRRYAIAFRLGDDVASVSSYQPGRTRVPLFNWDGSHDYFVALRAGEQPPDVDVPWVSLGDECGYRIMRAVVE